MQKRHCLNRFSNWWLTKENGSATSLIFRLTVPKSEYCLRNSRWVSNPAVTTLFLMLSNYLTILISMRALLFVDIIRQHKFKIHLSSAMLHSSLYIFKFTLSVNFSLKITNTNYNYKLQIQKIFGSCV